VVWEQKGGRELKQLQEKLNLVPAATFKAATPAGMVPEKKLLSPRKVVRAVRLTTERGRELLKRLF